MEPESKTNVRTTVEAVVESLHWFADTADERTVGDLNSFWRHAEAAVALETDLARLAQVARSHQMLRLLAGRINVVHDAVFRALGPPSQYAPDSGAADQRPPMRDSTRRWLLKRDGKRQVVAKLDDYRARCRAAGLAGEPKPLIGGHDQITRRHDRLPEQARALANDLAAVAALLPSARQTEDKPGRKRVDPDGTVKLVGDWEAYHLARPGTTRANFIRDRKPDLREIDLVRAQARVRKARKPKSGGSAPNPSSQI